MNELPADFWDEEKWQAGYAVDIKKLNAALREHMAIPIEIRPQPKFEEVKDVFDSIIHTHIFLTGGSGILIVAFRYGAGGLSYTTEIRGDTDAVSFTPDFTDCVQKDAIVKTVLFYLRYYSGVKISLFLADGKIVSFKKRPAA
jgi:hypothetical protein